MTLEGTELERFYKDVVDAQRLVQSDLTFETEVNRLATAVQYGKLDKYQVAQLEKDFWEYQFLAETRKDSLGEPMSSGGKHSPKETPWIRQCHALPHVSLKIGTTGRQPPKDLKRNDVTLDQLPDKLTKSTLDFVTFSTVPSAFNFFYSSSDVGRFVDFLCKLPEKKCDYRYPIMRVLFRTPSFLTLFVEAVIAPHLPHIVDEDPSIIAEKIKKSIQDWPGKLPGYLGAVLRNRRIEKLFGWTQDNLANLESFINDCFLSDLAKYPHKFFACRYFDPHEVFASRSDELKNAFNDKRIGLLIAEAIYERCEEVPGAVETYVFFNEKDLEVLGHSGGDIRNRYVIRPEENVNNRLFVSYVGGPIDGTIDCARGLKQLLKRAPQLPESPAYVGLRNQSRPDALYEWLVRSAGMEQFVPQHMLFEKLECNTWSDDVWGKVFEALKGLCQTAVDESKQQLHHFLRNNNPTVQRARTNAQAVVLYQITRDFWTVNKFPWKSLSEYVYNTETLVDDITSWRSKFGAYWGEGDRWPEIEFHYVFHHIGFTFNSYRLARADLRSQDDMFYSRMLNTEFDLCRQPEGKHTLMLLRFQRKLLNSMDIIREAMDVFNEDCDPITKAEGVNRLLIKVFGLIPSLGGVEGEVIELMTRIFFMFGWIPTSYMSTHSFVSIARHLGSAPNDVFDVVLRLGKLIPQDKDQ